MMRLRPGLWRQLSAKLDYFRASFACSSLSQDLRSTHHLWTSSAANLSRLPPVILPRRSKCTAAAVRRSEDGVARHHSEMDPSATTSCTEKPSVLSDFDLAPQSITPYRFNDPCDDDDDAVQRIHVLERWKSLLDQLRTIVDGFDSASTAVRDVTAVRQTLERHNVARFLVRPYSYTADDATSSFLVCGEPILSGVWDSSNAAIGGKIVAVGLSPPADDGHGGDVIGESKLSSVRQRSSIDRLEEESLRAVVMLSAGPWSVYDCDGTDSWNAGIGTSGSLRRIMTLCRADDVKNEDEKSSNSKGRPNRHQLVAVQQFMAENLPKIFVKFHSYDVYTNNLVFENNWYSDKSYITEGLLPYALEIAKLRLFVHFKYANVKMQLLKTTIHEDDGTVRIRWRISGIPQTKAIMFWKFLSWGQKSSSVESEWLDGFSTFFVEESGLIFKHKMDRVIPDDGLEIKVKQTIIEKLGIKIPAPQPAAT